MSLAAQSFLARIGLVAVQWSHIEVQFSHAIWYLLGLDAATGKIVTGGLDMLPRANMAIKLCRHLDGPKELLNALIVARKSIQGGLDQKRNQIIHGVHQSTDDIAASMIEVHRGKGSGRPERISIKELNELCAQLSAVREPLEDIMQKVLQQGPARIVMVRKTRSAKSETESSPGTKSHKT